MQTAFEKQKARDNLPLVYNDQTPHFELSINNFVLILLLSQSLKNA